MPIIKTYSEFLETLQNASPSEDWEVALKSLWYDAKGDWNTAHDLMDGKNTITAKWIHAYLHRKEGDEWNAGYWYRQAGKSFPEITLVEEHQRMVEFLLANQ